jgi:hypothetical protein
MFRTTGIFLLEVRGRTSYFNFRRKVKISSAAYFKETTSKRGGQVKFKTDKRQTGLGVRFGRTLFHIGNIRRFCSKI